MDMEVRRSQRRIGATIDSGCKAGWYVERAAQGNHQVGIVAAHADLFHKGDYRLPCLGDRFVITPNLPASTQAAHRHKAIWHSASPSDSSHCATQPAVRASAKMQGNIEGGMPSALRTMPE